MVADAIKYKRGLIPRSALSHCAIFRKVSSDIRDSIFAHVQDSLDKLGVLPWFEINNSSMAITFAPTGQHFKFHGCDDETKIKGFKNYKDPYILVLGDHEAEENTVSINVRGSNKQIQNVPLDKFVAFCQKLNREHTLELPDEID